MLKSRALSAGSARNPRIEDRTKGVPRSRKVLITTSSYLRGHAMKSFLSRFHALVLFTLSGFDRLRFCGESRLLNHSRGVQSYCYQQRLLFKDFPEHAETLTKILRNETAKNRGDVPIKH